MCTGQRFVCSREGDVVGKDNCRRRRRFSCQPPRNLSSNHCKVVAFLLFLLSGVTAGHWGRYTFSNGLVECKTAGCFLAQPRKIERRSNFLRNQYVRNQLTQQKQTRLCYFAKPKCRNLLSLPLKLASISKNDFCDDLQDQSTSKQISKKGFPQKKKRRKRLRSDFNVLGDNDVNGRAKSKQKRRQQRRRSSKSLRTSTVSHMLTKVDLNTTPTSQSMPPWLSQYTHEDVEKEDHFMDYPVARLLPEAPPELDVNEKDTGNVEKKISTIGDTVAQSNELFGQKRKQNLVSEKLERLALSMSGILSETSTLKTTQTHHSAPFTPNQINEVLDSIRIASHNNLNLMMGCADFLYLMLTLEERDVIHDRGINDGNNPKIGDLLAPTKTLIITREVLVAAAFHYCDCVRARKAGVYDVVRMFAEAGGTATFKEETFLTPYQNQQQYEHNLELSPHGVNSYAGGALPQRSQPNPFHYDEDTTIVVTKKTVHRRGKSPIEKFGEESVRIAAGAAKLKRAEVMATTLNGLYDARTSLEPTHSRKKRKPTNADTLSSDASILRNFLVSLSEDWRALVIRSAACLYRLNGIVEEENNNITTNKSKIIYSSTSMQTARDALRVYAPLAQRMGMQRLKSEIENTAFRILYRRQYEVASALHDSDFGEMQMIIEVLRSRIQQLLMSDQVFMANVDDIIVSSRVKEPYSLWKKILRYRKEAIAARTEQDDEDRIEESKSSFKPTQISTKWVPDAIALRVVIRGKKMSTENEESLRSREKMLCYFAFQLIADVWPPSKSNIAKDYIKQPKPNGYQSLHYTAALVISGEEWPFEVQIRSEEMHQIAEYGIAAHWDYKLQSKTEKSFFDNSNGKPFALPPPSRDVENVDKSMSSGQLAQDIVRPTSDTTSIGQITSYIEALTTSREILVENNVFVFISSSKNALDGRLISLDPSSRLVADVLMQYGGIREREIVDTISSG
ncbi:hypothetical protein ACHAWX_006289 [Stephanocyclus meneghinianus]